MSHYDTNSFSPSSTTNALRIGFLNCRSLAQLSDSQQRSHFIRFLRDLRYDVLCFQETTADLPSTQSMLNTQFLTNSAIWSKHCGIVSLNHSILITPDFITIEQRVIACHISQVNHLFPPTFVLVTYAPAQRVQRGLFFDSLLKLPLLHHYTPFTNDLLSFNTNPSLPPMLILGDFNFQITDYQGKPVDTYDTNLLHPQHRWYRFLASSFYECSQHSDQLTPALPTFRRGNHSSTIDYIFASPVLFHHLHSSTVDFINSAWTDHAFLGCTFTFQSYDQGPGLWRGHPNLAQNTHFKDTLFAELDQFHSFMQSNSNPPSPQEQWDTIKDITRKIARKIGRRKAAAHQRLLARLQRKRNHLLREYKLTNILPLRLEAIEKQIGAIQQDRVDTLALRAGKHWRENGETSAGYLKSAVTSRAAKRNIPILTRPHAQQLCTSNSDMHSAATAFYETLYTPSPINPTSLSTLADAITSMCCSQEVAAGPLAIRGEGRNMTRATVDPIEGTSGFPSHVVAGLLTREC